MNAASSHPGVQSGLFFFEQRFHFLIQRILACVQLRFLLSKLLFSDCILFLAGANHRKKDDYRQNQIFFISDVSWGVGQFGEENGRPTASQMKPAETVGSALSLPGAGMGRRKNDDIG